VTITVKQLKAELEKFRDDAICYAYEGEVRGVVICPPGGWGGPGVIYMEDETKPEEPRSDVFPEVAAVTVTGAP
jgi:hypothetical protein